MAKYIQFDKDYAKVKFSDYNTHIQNQIKTNNLAIKSSIINYDPTKVYVLDGCVPDTATSAINDGFPIKAITKGTLYYGGESYTFDGWNDVTNNYINSKLAYLHIEDYVDKTINPVRTFKNEVINPYKEKRIIANTSSTGNIGNLYFLEFMPFRFVDLNVSSIVLQNNVEIVIMDNYLFKVTGKYDTVFKKQRYLITEKFKRIGIKPNHTFKYNLFVKVYTKQTSRISILSPIYNTSNGYLTLLYNCYIYDGITEVNEIVSVSVSLN